MYLYHYYDKKSGPFRNLSDLSLEEAEVVLAQMRKEKPQTQCALRQESYMKDRLFYEDILRTEFKKQNGRMERFVPHYMVVEHSPWLSTWYEDCAVVKIPIEEFDTETLSFTYGDSILKVIDKYGLPQDWNDDGRFGPERYVEVHVWSDKTINNFRSCHLQCIKHLSVR